MPIGYRGHADWRDMSEYVVHFAKDVPGGKSAYNSMISILYSGKLEARTRFGAIRWSDALGDSQGSVCFSEIPLDRLDRLVQRRSKLRDRLPTRPLDRIRWRARLVSE